MKDKREMFNITEKQVKYMGRTIAGLIFVIVAAYMLLNNMEVPNWLIGLIIATYGFQQVADGVSSSRHENNNKDKP